MSIQCSFVRAQDDKWRLNFMTAATQEAIKGTPIKKQKKHKLKCSTWSKTCSFHRLILKLFQNFFVITFFWKITNLLRIQQRLSTFWYLDTPNSRTRLKLYPLTYPLFACPMGTRTPGCSLFNVSLRLRLDFLLFSSNFVFFSIMRI